MYAGYMSSILTSGWIRWRQHSAVEHCLLPRDSQISGATAYHKIGMFMCYIYSFVPDLLLWNIFIFGFIEEIPQTVVREAVLAILCRLHKPDFLSVWLQSKWLWSLLPAAAVPSPVRKREIFFSCTYLIRRYENVRRSSTDVFSRNRCYNGKAVSITYSECALVDVRVQHEPYCHVWAARL